MTLWSVVAIVSLLLFVSTSGHVSAVLVSRNDRSCLDALLWGGWDRGFDMIPPL